MVESSHQLSLASLFTPQGRGAVASIRLRGEVAQLSTILTQHFQPRGQQPLGVIGDIRYGAWSNEDVVICRTDDLTWEIHCHGGVVAPERILSDLRSAGVTVVLWHEFIAAESSPLAAEFQQVLAKTTTLKTAEYVLRQANGLFVREITSIKQAIEAGNDIPRCIERLQDILRWATFGQRLTQPASVVIAGRPNVGKSSLINALLGYTRSIVYDQPGTTRDIVTAETAFDGWPVALTDTAGMHETSDALEHSGIERAREKLQAADCRIILLDRSQPLQDFGRQLLNEFPDAIIVVHKIDLSPAWSAAEFPQRINVSSKTGQGVDRLMAAIVEQLFPQLPPNEQALPLTERQCENLRQAVDALHGGETATAAATLSALIA